MYNYSILEFVGQTDGKVYGYPAQHSTAKQSISSCIIRNPGALPAAIKPKSYDDLLIVQCYVTYV